MCKNADNPCPGCRRHTQAEAALMFFTKEERERLDTRKATETPSRP